MLEILSTPVVQRPCQLVAMLKLFYVAATAPRSVRRALVAPLSIDEECHLAKSRVNIVGPKALELMSQRSMGPSDPPSLHLR